MLLSTETHDALHALRYRSPSRLWTDALPVGNGLRGAMSAGLVGGERLWLNDATAWSGVPDSDPMKGIDDRGPDALDAVREAVDADDIATAEQLLRRQQSTWAQAYLPLATLDLEVDADAADDDDLLRTLDLTTGIATHAYAAAAGRVRHETWADAVTGVIVHRVIADAPVRVSVRIDSLLRRRSGPSVRNGVLSAEWFLPVDVAPGHEHPPEPIRYDVERGRIGAVAIHSSAPSTLVDGMLRTAASAEHTFTIGTATSSADGTASADAATAAANARGDAEALRAAHISAHRELYSRCMLELPSPTDALDLDTDERIRRAEQHPDPGLAALAFHYGRYLLMSSSRPGGPPANLQGIWNAELPGPWSSAYTTNINLQMAYWPAEVTSLAECHLPLLQFIGDVSRTSGHAVARELYGADGWVMHHNSDIWGHAAPVGDGHGDPAWAFWPLGGVWLVLHLWERHRFGGDLRRLAEDWPVFEQTARFALSWVRSDGRRAWTSPSTSPENQYLDADGTPRGVGVSSTMDVMLLRELADACTRISTILGHDDAWVRELASLAALLPDPRVSERGMLQEWADRREDADPHHRHLSHLIGLFPFMQITPESAPELAAAAAASIIGRGAESTGWALAWRAAMWARLGDGERVHQQVRMALRSAADAGSTEHRGGLYRNMFSAHPPFQIDGNLGLTAAIAEALVQSQEDSIRVLPSLPPGWPDGSVRGIRTRAGVTVDVAWASGLVTRIALRSTESRRIHLSAPGMREQLHRVAPGEPTIIEPKEPG
ncbi:glycosyl hydrolase family 95 catalytic domain-containing protein [Microbacterium murale]|uniref:Alpha-L-fucosidase 2 n=1 Tax=Microbacterium murale TaxID=1081040 RepID=A0ABU0PBB0_9MICO|nr:glycoside hydrolase N-terminal domain-containing protein [Microbacterium murale]MDQ0644625.1 alpha-L-fucosidase 2 [Microbacterium murale]